MLARYEFEFDERPDELGNRKLVLTVRKTEAGKVTESHTSGPSADITRHEVDQLERRVATLGTGRGTLAPPLKLAEFETRPRTRGE